MATTKKTTRGGKIGTFRITEEGVHLYLNGRLHDTYRTERGMRQAAAKMGLGEVTEAKGARDTSERARRAWETRRASGDPGAAARKAWETRRAESE